MNDSKSSEKEAIVYVCLGSSCHLKGAYKVVEKLRDLFADENIEMRGSLCMGNCSKGVNVKVGDEIFENISESNVEELVGKIKESLVSLSGSKKVGEGR
ncbi:Thioredoxin-like [2Fe-2S] ferredoxin [Fervidobacterium changbaicum]|uniref:Thioredoxin-like [2Fe-2S] ferredoxin n=1 Tax=Fervidobacterium changbaicum TaxID=310769 RepID=A0ABX5QQG0_9BACT|nr:NAD(P)H-dependent oxidoreductase subunit E [Fervidobacterium changbaicum]QAV32598.1 hypothetical protein CBS1_01765 [Fervidobacterium changbaicum]SDH34102.1 Thioredoxin-like [2Fe-2S] ferredoxin [Fervidobacterium changbaicum]